MPYVFHDRQSVPKWMPGGNAVTTAVYEGACVRMWVGGWKCECVHVRRREHICASMLAHMTKCVLVCVSVCPAQCAADTWHFPWSAHFNDFIDMNVFLSIDHIS